MKKKDQLSKNARKSAHDNAKDILGGEFFVAKSNFNYFTMRGIDGAKSTKGKYSKTFKVNTTKPL